MIIQTKIRGIKYLDEDVFLFEFISEVLDERAFMIGQKDDVQWFGLLFILQASGQIEPSFSFLRPSLNAAGHMLSFFRKRFHLCLFRT